MDTELRSRSLDNVECPSFSAKALDHILETVMFVIVFGALLLPLCYTEWRLFFSLAFEPYKGGSLLSSFEFNCMLLAAVLDPAPDA